MANRATDSHTHKGVVSLVILIAHVRQSAAILAALVSPGRATMAQFGSQLKGNGAARVRMTHICRRAIRRACAGQVAVHGTEIASFPVI